jgi:hypothetical protein
MSIGPTLSPWWLRLEAYSPSIAKGYSASRVQWRIEQRIRRHERRDTRTRRSPEPRADRNALVEFDFEAMREESPSRSTFHRAPGRVAFGVEGNHRHFAHAAHRDHPDFRRIDAADRRPVAQPGDRMPSRSKPTPMLPTPAGAEALFWSSVAGHGRA